MIRIYERAKAECSYNATRFLQMVIDQGGLKAAKTLLSHPDISSGLEELWKCRRLGISMEAVVLRQPGCQLFCQQELAAARRKLEDLGYKPEVQN
ncbi:MAG TPA: hypothetical protein VGY31_02070 [Terriglobia bacterium]|nr:hypothetical protein [Terriglobia bacterium]